MKPLKNSLFAVRSISRLATPLAKLDQDLIKRAEHLYKQLRKWAIGGIPSIFEESGTVSVFRVEKEPIKGLDRP